MVVLVKLMMLAIESLQRLRSQHLMRRPEAKALLV
jgi:hypothetical protein